MSVATGLTSASQRYPVKKRAIVAHDRGLTEDYPRRVVNHHAFADLAPRVNVHAEDLRHAALDGKSQRLPVFLPEDVSDTACLQAQVAPDNTADSEMTFWG